MTFDDLVFSPIKTTPAGDVSQAIVRFDNGFGLSVLSGPGTLTTSDRPYEAAVICFSLDGSYRIVYPEFTHHDVLAFLTRDQVTEYIAMVGRSGHVVTR